MSHPSRSLSAMLLLFGIFSAAILSGACGPAANNSGKANENKNATPSAATPTVKRCDAAMDQKINEDLFEATVDPVKGDQELRAKKTQFNFHSSNCQVLLYGYVNTLAHFKKLSDFAEQTANVASVSDARLFLVKSDYPDLVDNQGNCAGGLQPCGEICVPPGQCNTNRPTTPTPTPTPATVVPSPTTK